MPKLRVKKTRVAVLMGGPSSEHEVSLVSGKNVLKAFGRGGNKRKYDAVPLLITKRGEWKLGHYYKEPRRALKRFDVVFNALHGEYGEDGMVQSVLERLHVKFTGSKQLACALAMDKVSARHLFQESGLTVPKAVVLQREYFLGHSFVLATVRKVMSLPCVVKPVRRGSSVGIELVKHERELRQSVERAFKHDDTVLIEEYVQGREVTCGVLQVRGKALALPPTEIIPKHSTHFDYKSKYKKGWTREITPAGLETKLLIKVQEAAVRAHEVLGCRHYSRTDMMVTDDQVYVLELNALPGLTKTSLFPQATTAYGLSFEELVDYLVQLALAEK